MDVFSYVRVFSNYAHIVSWVRLLCYIVLFQQRFKADSWVDEFLTGKLILQL